MMHYRKKARSSSKRSNSKPTSQFKLALRKLTKCRSDKKKYELIKNSSDDFIRDLAAILRKCYPIYKPILKSNSLNKLRSFTNPRSSISRRRKMIQHGGGDFLGMLKDLGHSVVHVLKNHPSLILSAAELLV